MEQAAHDCRQIHDIAHRGASAYAPENTFSAFDRALDLGIDQVELDVQFTSDGQLVVIHDERVDRTTSGSGPVATHSLAQPEDLDAGSWFGPQFDGERIRSLAEILERYQGRFHFHIELKATASDLAERTVDLIRAFGMSGDVTIISFKLERLQEVRQYAPLVPTGWLVSDCSAAEIKQSLAEGLTMQCPRADLITPSLVNRLHQVGLVVRAWGVTTEALMRQVVDGGADGVTINFPDRLTEYLDSQRTA